MVMMIMMNKNFNCFVFRAGRYLQASGQRVCLANMSHGGVVLFFLFFFFEFSHTRNWGKNQDEAEK